MGFKPRCAFNLAKKNPLLPRSKRNPYEQLNHEASHERFNQSNSKPVEMADLSISPANERLQNQTTTFDGRIPVQSTLRTSRNFAKLETANNFDLINLHGNDRFDLTETFYSAVSEDDEKSSFEAPANRPDASLLEIEPLLPVEIEPLLPIESPEDYPNQRGTSKILRIFGRIALAFLDIIVFAALLALLALAFYQPFPGPLEPDAIDNGYLESFPDDCSLFRASVYKQCNLKATKVVARLSGERKSCCPKIIEYLCYIRSKNLRNECFNESWLTPNVTHAGHLTSVHWITSGLCPEIGFDPHYCELDPFFPLIVNWIPFLIGLICYMIYCTFRC